MLAQWFAPEVAAHITLGDMSDAVRFVVAFALVFILAAFAGGLVASLVKKLVEAVGMRPVDRSMGALFGLLRGLVLLLAFTVVVGADAHAGKRLVARVGGRGPADHGVEGSAAPAARQHGPVFGLGPVHTMVRLCAES